MWGILTSDASERKDIWYGIPTQTVSGMKSSLNFTSCIKIWNNIAVFSYYMI